MSASLTSCTVSLLCAWRHIIFFKSVLAKRLLHCPHPQPDGGIYFEKVHEGGAAHKAGIKAGDRIIAIGSMNTEKVCECQGSKDPCEQATTNDYTQQARRSCVQGNLLRLQHHLLANTNQLRLFRSHQSYHSSCAPLFL